MLDPQQALARLVSGSGLSSSEMEHLFGRLMDGELDDSFKAALLVALAMKGESAEEVAGAAAAMRRRVVRVPTERDNVVDTCGTGGDGKGTFNISTAAALTAAAAGVPVAKHGNRAVSSRSGSADVLAALGVTIDLSPERSALSLQQVGIAFLFAPKHHPAMREVMPVRNSLGIRTIFNVLGPLTNPAGARRQVVGVYSERLVDLVADVLARLGSEHALVVHGADGLDELTTTGPTRVAEVRDGRVESYDVTPETFGLERVPLAALAGGEPQKNAERMMAVLAGDPGPLADITAFNAGAAIHVAGLAESLAEGVERAQQTLSSGEACHKLEELRAFSEER